MGQAAWLVSRIFQPIGLTDGWFLRNGRQHTLSPFWEKRENEPVLGLDTAFDNRQQFFQLEWLN